MSRLQSESICYIKRQENITNAQEMKYPTHIYLMVTLNPLEEME